jgi:hypothetical protein
LCFKIVSDEEPEEAERSELDDEGVVVLLGPWASIKAYLNEQQPRNVNMTKRIWILAPTDAPWEAVTDDAAGLSQGTLVLAPSAEPSLHLDSVVTQETLEALGAKLVGSEAPIPELRRAASVVLEAAACLREALLEDCGQVAMCAALRPLTERNSSIAGIDASWAQGSLEPPVSARPGPLEPVVRLGRIETEGSVLEPIGDLEKGHIKAENGSAVHLMLRIEGGCGRDCICLNQVGIEILSNEEWQINFQIGVSTNGLESDHMARRNLGSSCDLCCWSWSCTVFSSCRFHHSPHCQRFTLQGPRLNLIIRVCSFR